MADDPDIQKTIAFISACGAPCTGPTIAEWTSLANRIETFFKVNYPPPRTVEYDDWRFQALSLGRSAIPLLLLWMRDGSADEQTLSMFALREICGYAWAFGDGTDEVFRVVVDEIAVTVSPSTRTILVRPAEQEPWTKEEPGIPRPRLLP
jgi:hypothetical protein